MSKPFFLLSLHDKASYGHVLDSLKEINKFQFVATDGTAQWCEDRGVKCQSIDDLFDLSPRLDGQVKSLDSDIYTSLLASSQDELPDGIPVINGLIVDLTPFESDGDYQRKKVDIGGVSLLRAGVKNHQNVVPLADVESAEVFVNNYPPSEHAREWLASRALRQTLKYDKQLLGQIDQSVGNQTRSIHCSLPAHKTLRYGENPSQKGYYRADLFHTKPDYDRQAGDKLSFTNLLDIDSAWNLVNHSDEIQVSVIKHTNPTGWAKGNRPSNVIQRAWQSDPKSAFGGVVGINKEVTQTMIDVLEEYFIEAVVAPGFQEDVIARLDNEDRPRLVSNEQGESRHDSIYSLGNGYLTQTPVDPFDQEENWENVTKKTVSDSNQDALRQMWRICRWVTSNAVVIGTKNHALAIGAGQQSRVDAVDIAVRKLGEHHPENADSLVMASDGFFPFPDNIELASKAGVSSIISPGGSVKDEQVIKTAERNNISMIFTGQRIFQH